NVPLEQRNNIQSKITNRRYKYLHMSSVSCGLNPCTQFWKALVDKTDRNLFGDHESLTSRIYDAQQVITSDDLK
ncbi:uncharacterized protein BX664DRAFT_250017, partial [Halteromyces radiatus]|uniref:uncharacterized protein n=1 Tax=Halteromyces radiatus TaxID=101107 RepID=UPI00221FBDB5